MRHRIKLPPLGDGVESATIVEWGPEVGSTVDVGDSLVVVALDKVDTHIPAPLAGTLAELLAEPGDEVRVGGPLCIIDT